MPFYFYETLNTVIHKDILFGKLWDFHAFYFVSFSTLFSVHLSLLIHPSSFTFLLSFFPTCELCSVVLLFPPSFFIFFFYLSCLPSSAVFCVSVSIRLGFSAFLLFSFFLHDSPGLFLSSLLPIPKPLPPFQKLSLARYWLLMTGN